MRVIKIPVMIKLFEQKLAVASLWEQDILCFSNVFFLKSDAFLMMRLVFLLSLISACSQNLPKLCVQKTILGCFYIVFSSVNASSGIVFFALQHNGQQILTVSITFNYEERNFLEKHVSTMICFSDFRLRRLRITNIYALFYIVLFPVW